MNAFRLLLLLLVMAAAGVLHAQTPQERAQKVAVTLSLTDVAPGDVAHFVELLSNVKIHFQGRPGDTTVLSVNFENVTTDEALKYIAKLADLELAYKDDGAYFTPKK